MKRREAAVGLLAFGAGIEPSNLLAQASPAARVYRIAVLTALSANPGAPLWAAFVMRLKKLGYIEGQNLVLDVRSIHGLDTDGLDTLVADVIGLKPDVIMVPGTSTAVRAAKAASSIPIVMRASVDPVGAGLARHARVEVWHQPDSVFAAASTQCCPLKPIAQTLRIHPFLNPKLPDQCSIKVPVTLFSQLVYS